MASFEAIKVDMASGKMEYPAPVGFKLDMEKMYRVAGLFMAHCSVEMAVKHAIHDQIAAYEGAS